MSTETIEEIIQEYCKAVQAGDADVIEDLFSPAATIITYNESGSLAKMTPREYAEYTSRTADNSDFLSDHDISSDKLLSLEPMDDDDTMIAKLAVVRKGIAYEELLSFRQQCDQWLVVGRILSQADAS